MLGILNSFKLFEIECNIANADVTIKLVTIINVFIRRKNECDWLQRIHIILNLSLYMVNKVIYLPKGGDLIIFIKMI